MKCRTALLCLAALNAAACAGERRVEEVVVRDSAGIRIVAYQNPLFELGTEWSIDSIPTLTIGVAEGDAEYELDDVVNAVRLQNGALVIADRGKSQVIAFDGRGRFLRTLGGPGEGPGEFGSIGWLQLVGSDTLLIYDPDLRRVTALTLESGLAGFTALRGAGYAVPGNFRLSKGTFVLALAGNDVWDAIRRAAVLPGAAARNRTHFVTFSSDGLLTDTIGSFEGYEEAVTDRDGIATMYPPWGRSTSYALTPDDRIVVGTQETGKLAVIDQHGLDNEVVRWPAGDLTITADYVDQFHDVMFQRIDDPAEKQAAIDQLGELPLPESRAVYGELLTDARGLVWVAEAHLPLTSAREWRAIDRESGDVARVIVPPNFDLLWIGEDEVIGRTRDDMGVQRVEVRALRRGV